MKVFSTKQIRDIDQYTIQNEQISSIELMERAASAFVDSFCSFVSVKHNVFIFAGPGNNGGDALSIARLLNQKGYRIEVFLFNPKGKLSSDCEQNKQRLVQIDSIRFVEVKDSFALPDIKKTDIVIDGLFGSGLTQPLSGGFASLVKQINKLGAYVVSIDIPSGLYGEDNSLTSKDAIVVRANKTLTFQFPKLAFFFPDNSEFVGDWEVLDINLSPDIISQTKLHIAHWMKSL